MQVLQIRRRRNQDTLRAPLRKICNDHCHRYRCEDTKLATQNAELNGKNDKRKNEQIALERLVIFPTRSKQERRRHRIPIRPVSTVCERALPHAHRLHLRRNDARSLIVRRLRKPVRAVLDELLHAHLRAPDDGPVQSGKVLLVRRVDAGAPAEEQIHHRWKTFICCPHQAGVALRVGTVDGYVLVQEKQDKEDVAVKNGEVEDIVALSVGQERVRAVLQEQIDDVVVAALDCPHCWRRDCFSA